MIENWILSLTKEDLLNALLGSVVYFLGAVVVLSIAVILSERKRLL